jgi:hypothetical protein
VRRTGYTYQLKPNRLDIERPEDVRIEIDNRDAAVHVYVNSALVVKITRSRSPVVVREYE